MTNPGVIYEIWALQVAVIPAKAGIQSLGAHFRRFAEWIPAFAGMTALSATSAARRPWAGAPCNCRMRGAPPALAPARICPTLLPA